MYSAYKGITMQTIKMIQCNPPFKLSTGRVVMTRPEPNGSRFAYLSGTNDNMTDAEWSEFCAYSVKLIPLTRKAGK
jgi:hypothetical protein